MNRMERQGAWGTAIALLLCALIVYPKKEEREGIWMTTWYVSQNQLIPVEQARQERDALLALAQRLEKSGALDLDKMFSIQKQLIRLNRYAEQRGPNPRAGTGYSDNITVNMVLAIRDRLFEKVSEADRDAYSDRFDTDPELQTYNNFVPSTTTTDYVYGGKVLALRLILSIPFGLVLIISVLMLDGVSPGKAIGIMLSRPLLALSYPIGVFAFMFGRRQTDLRQLTSFLVYATVSGVSLLFGGTAFAQVAKKDSGRKKETFPLILQLDARKSSPVGDPPSRFEMLRFFGHGWTGEASSTESVSSKTWTREFSMGWMMHRPAKGHMFNLLGGFNQNSRGVTNAVLGLQYFRAGPRLSMAIPAARIEKAKGGPWGVFAVFNPIYRFGVQNGWSHVGLSPDVSVRKTQGRPAILNAGLGVNWLFQKGKGNRLETAVLRSNKGQWMARGRLILNFEF